MNKADKYFIEALKEIKDNGVWCKEPRTRWKDGSKAYYKSIHQKHYRYEIDKGEFPITTLRNTALKGAFYDVEAIYIKQTNIIEEMHPSIHSWWEDFVVSEFNIQKLVDDFNESVGFELASVVDKGYIENKHSIGKTYGSTIKRYFLVDKLLKGMEENPFSRRHIINMWQEQQMIDDPKALVPCAFMTEWYVIEEEENYQLMSNPPKKVFKRRINFTLTQRSQDFLTTASINPAQYVMLAMMICNHLTFKTGIKHYVGTFVHNVGDTHVYDRHFEALEEILERESLNTQPTIELVCQPKDFYEHIIQDFKFSGLEGIKPLSNKLEIAV